MSPATLGRTTPCTLSHDLPYSVARPPVPFHIPPVPCRMHALCVTSMNLTPKCIAMCLTAPLMYFQLFWRFDKHIELCVSLVTYNKTRKCHFRQVFSQDLWAHTLHTSEASPYSLQIELRCKLASEQNCIKYGSATMPLRSSLFLDLH